MSEIVLGNKLVLEGDINEMKEQCKKRGGQQRVESSFRQFKEYIRDMNMGEIKFLGRHGQTIEEGRGLWRKG